MDYKIGIIKNLNNDQLELAINTCEIIVTQYNSGESIFVKEHNPEYLYMLIDGVVEISETSITGNKNTLTLIENKGELFGEVYFFTDKPYEIDSKALKNSKIIRLSHNLFKHYPFLLEGMISVFANKTYSMNKKLRIISKRTLKEKIAAYLADKKKNEIILNVGREELASFLNVSRPSLSRELSKMEDEGIIRVSGKKIEIINKELFEELL